MDIKTEFEIDPLHIPLQIKTEPIDEDCEFENLQSEDDLFQGTKATSEIKIEPPEFDAMQIKIEPVEEYCTVETTEFCSVESAVQFEHVEIKPEELKLELISEENDDNSSSLEFNSEIHIKDETSSKNVENSGNNNKKQTIKKVEVTNITCNICGEIIKGSTALIEHKKTKHKNQISSCDICNKSMKTCRNLFEHLNSVHSDQEFKCKECDYLASSRKYLLFHIRYHHKNLNEEHKCEFCGKIFKKFNLVREHYMRIHANPSKVYSCKICNLDYKESSSLRKHNNKKHKNMK